MVLPISKSALDRLGVRLAAGEVVSDDDLADLARVVDIYQNVLNGVKLKLTDLAYDATTRIKTTGTLVDKLRRETARLSQVQDLAGARIVVSDRSSQDKAVDRISDVFEAAGCTVRQFDRRKNPSHGYRAIHLVVQVDKVPVEIQIRSELQDGWAQIVERLADTWGRGIRYGGDPDDAESPVNPGGKTTRRDVISLLMQLGDLIAQVEERQVSFWKATENFESALRVGETIEVPGGTSALIVGDTMPEDAASAFERSVEELRSTNSEMGSLLAGWQQMTIAQFVEAIRATAQVARQHRDRRGEQLRSLDVSLRGMLEEIVAAIGLG